MPEMRRSRRGAGRALARWLPPALVLLAALAGWEAAARLGWLPLTVARPSAVLRLLAAEYAGLLAELAPTLFAAAWGYLLALAVAVALGSLAYLYKSLEGTVLTVGAVFNSIPIIAIAPALIIWLGLSLSTRVAITTVVCFFPLLIAFVQGLNTRRATAAELFTVLAATPLQRFRLLALPGALPYLFMGMKITAPFALLGALVGEWTGAESGLGVVMLNAMFGLQVDRLWATVLLACVVSTAAYAYVCLLERLALPADLREGEAV